MELKPIAWTVLWPTLLALALCGCKRGSSAREAPITGARSDPPVTMRARWQPGERYVYRAEVITSSQMPRRNTGKIVRADTTLGQDLAFTVTNLVSEGSRVLQMEILAVQMETSRDDGVMMNFDSDNKTIFAEDNPAAERLQKLVGARLAFHLSPENGITRVDGGRELTDRLSANNNSVRGMAGNLLGRFFSPQFFKELVEMGMLPKDPVKIGETWSVTRPANTGLPGTGAAVAITYKFRGWQMHDGTNCARLEFSGTFKPNTDSRTNQSLLRKLTAPANQPALETGTLTGQSWFSPELGLAIETVCDQSFTTKSTTVRRTRVAAGTNNLAVIDPVSGTNAPGPTNPPPPASVTSATNTTTTTIQQHTSLKLVEVEPLEK